MFKQSIIAIFLAFSLFCASCGNGVDKELFETAQFEEQQNNKVNAVKLYKEIIDKHPGSSYRAKADERLKAIEQRK